MSDERPLDLVVFGATGYTGRLVCEHLRDRDPSEPPLRWAIGGRDPAKLEKLHTDLGLGPEVGLVEAEGTDPRSLDAMAAATRLVLSAAGPYRASGAGLVRACAEAGIDYVDICGEVDWMREMIDRHEATAVQSGARIVFACGFDSVPSDLGVFGLQQLARTRHDAVLPRIKMRIRWLRGSGSGGSMATFAGTVAAARHDPAVAAVRRDPFALAGGFRGPQQPDGRSRVFEEDFGGWSGPFMMSAINTKIVHRSNYLSGHRYGADFVYDEMILLGPEPTEASGDMTADPTLRPGEGPSREEREAGGYDVLFRGYTADGDRVGLSVRADLDPGYGSTSKIVAESALCLLDTPRERVGFLTPATAMGAPLIERLESRAGVAFTPEP